MCLPDYALVSELILIRLRRKALLHPMTEKCSATLIPFLGKVLFLSYSSDIFKFSFHVP